MPMPMPGDEAERLRAEAADHLARMKGTLPPPLPAPSLPPIATAKRSLPVSAPVSRDVPTASGVKTSAQQTVTLNAEEREIAHASYHWMRRADAEAEWQKHGQDFGTFAKSFILS